MTGRDIEQVTDDKGRTWRVGDLCTYVYKELGAGVIYRVKAIKEGTRQYRNGPEQRMKIEPIFGFMQSIEGRKTRDVLLNYISDYYTTLEPVDLTRLGNEHLRFTQFVQAFVKARSDGSDVMRAPEEQL